MSKTAILTGASSGIGKAISEVLLDMDYEVFGIGRDFSEAEELALHPSFHRVELDLLNTSEVEKTIREMEERAAAMGVNTIRLDTFSWQGKEFYEALGYQAVGHYENAEDGYSEYFFLKRIKG